MIGNLKIKSEFRKILEEGTDNERIIGELLNIIKKDYILLAKEEVNCKDCINCKDNWGEYGISNIHYYCIYYQKPINHLHMMANDCNHFLSGKFEAKKSIAKMHYELTGEDYYL